MHEPWSLALRDVPRSIVKEPSGIAADENLKIPIDSTSTVQNRATEDEDLGMPVSDPYSQGSHTRASNSGLDSYAPLELTGGDGTYWNARPTADPIGFTPLTRSDPHRAVFTPKVVKMAETSPPRHASSAKRKTTKSHAPINGKSKKRKQTDEIDEIFGF
ncbi:hypothetical protein NEOLEDRAFT_1132269 [Neolentinus lepideus HHB14362 ss-1]|uniref:Uncharacterized protein n=1 Tax=Neolentinus lepideus HHB14362 ss-1 TaxID=1314782 RepID=A0A165T781_9AGAM|nr:hypothetical protein NEOLEDRAFT_1132269 [Neolentinus lepideus HHB14362 ss-1]